MTPPARVSRHLRVLATAIIAVALGGSSIAGASPLAAKVAATKQGTITQVIDGFKHQPMVVRPGVPLRQGPGGRAIRSVGRGVDKVADRLQRGRAAGKTGPVARFGSGLGKSLSYFAGEQTLTSASIEATIAGTYGLPWVAHVPILGKIGATGALYFRGWSGSVDYWQNHVPQHGRDVHFNRGGTVTTPIGGFGYDSLGKGTVLFGAPIPGGVVVGASNSRTSYVRAGIPYVLAGEIGEVHALNTAQYNRGSYFRVNGGVGHVGIFGVGAGVAVYYRPLEAITRILKPVANALQVSSDYIKSWRHPVVAAKATGRGVGKVAVRVANRLTGKQPAAAVEPAPATTASIP